VAAILADGKTLGLKPGEFEVVEWHDHDSPTKAFRAGFARGMKAGDTSSARMALAIAIAAADELNKGDRDFLSDAALAMKNARVAGEKITLGQALRGIIAAELVELGADIEREIIHRDAAESEMCGAHFKTLDIDRVCRLPNGHADKHSARRVVSSQPSVISQALDALDLVCEVCGDIVAWRHAAPGDYTGWVHLGNCIAQCHPHLDQDDYATPVVRMAVSA
jgi:hypothetical protein